MHPASDLVARTQLRSPLQHPADKSRPDQQQHSDSLASADMLGAIGLCESSFTRPPEPRMPTSRSIATGKPGRSAANGSATGCGAAITRRPGRPRAQRLFAQPSISAKRLHNSKGRNASFTSAPPSNRATSSDVAQTGSPTTLSMGNGGCCASNAYLGRSRRVPHDEASRRAVCRKSARLNLGKGARKLPSAASSAQWNGSLAMRCP